ncbi:TonB-linked outer membrane protein, SusC/RagA family [Mariniphaga anaerophila]|uniref:TonB-linked outer membrane protein, SusC/RagA family n=1 Tax=Mariniphaga anaerophila TaxID=1484053 RepID=A0A1M4SR16_9BACT|nr:TonB-dependent receptor [Mariniphaga anaerophila]SHE34615.1 TonB-linked outer membrane protein, SusC/RagA family [Mariniphaga anaerophila]
MKKKRIFRGFGSLGVMKLLVMMKLTSFFLFLSAMAMATGSYSQNIRFDLHVENATIIQVLEKIEGQTDYGFMFQTNQLDLNRQYNFDFKNAKIQTVLEEILDRDLYSYQIIDRIIVISKNGERALSSGEQNQSKISGKVTDSSGAALPGVTVVVKGTSNGTVTNVDGEYTISNIPDDATLQFSFIGMRTQEIPMEGKTTINVVMEEETIGIEEVVAIGYGTQKKSDITGSVASVSQERLNSTPIIDVAQAIQGDVPGVLIQTTSAGANPDEVLMIRGRNSIKANNGPLVIIDGITGSINDVNPKDIKSIDILKDASSGAIYGSRGANGVIIITTKEGIKGKTKITYDGYYSVSNTTNLPEYLTGDGFYKYKMERSPSEMTNTEREVYESGDWVNWQDLTLRKGFSQEHNLAFSGATEKTNYYISGRYLDVKGVRVNDNYKRTSGTVNLKTSITKWLSFNTNTRLLYEDQDGASPDFGGDAGGVLNPLVKPYNDDGTIRIYIWPEDVYFTNPLEYTLYKDKNRAYGVFSNNSLNIDIPFIPGLEYKINSGLRLNVSDNATYSGRNTKRGLESKGTSSTGTAISTRNVLENLLSYNKVFKAHSITGTLLYSFENNVYNASSTSGRNFSHDILTWYGTNEAGTKSVGFGYSKTVLMSQMFRLNYGYDGRYLITLTTRRDGYSGFGDNNKWGVFPSTAFGWNLAEETFFPWKDLFSQLKLRASWGENGNQAVNPYQSIGRLSSANNVSGSTTLPGYFPSTLGQDKLGWETSKTINFGLDYGLFMGRVYGDLNFYRTNTQDLLLDRTISSIHGIKSITSNLGKTQNKGIELSINSKNLINNFKWSTSGNISYVKNKIISLYGLLEEGGIEIDDIANRWFIGKPIAVSYNYVFDGVWQLDEAEEAAKWGSKPGYVKIKDLDGDYKITTNDMKVLGQSDPKILWGMTNIFSYGNLTLRIFLHGVHGVTKNNKIMVEQAAETRRNILNYNRWTVDNPSNEWPMNEKYSTFQGGIDMSGRIYQNASFIRLKDVVLSYNFSEIAKKVGLSGLNVYVTGRNLYTLTKWTSYDPEVNQSTYPTGELPLERSLIFGLKIDL